VSDNTDSQPLGNINEKSLKEIIHDNIDDLMSNFGNNCSSCKRCYGSTLAINQHIETGLREKIKNTLNSI
jgi:MoaA/NifB/PqqE/SkfB family radical SAM enzyme